MGMDIDKSRRDNAPLGINYPGGAVSPAVFDGGDVAIT